MIVMSPIDSKVFLNLPLLPHQIISLGGGAFSNEKIRKRSLMEGQTVFLSAPPEELVSRLSRSQETRPLLRDLDKTARLKRLREILDERQKDYDYAQLKLVTNKNSSEQLAGELIKKLQGSSR